MGRNVVVVGDGGVGKTAYIKKMMGDSFEKGYIPTYGKKVYPINIGEEEYKVWDISGQEKYSFSLPVVDVYKAIVCYDITSYLSGKNVAYWVNLIPQGIPVVIVGMKSDISRVKYDHIYTSIYLSAKSDSEEEAKMKFSSIM
jgi:GTP-binding nuclear protein Ran